MIYIILLAGVVALLYLLAPKGGSKKTKTEYGKHDIDLAAVKKHFKFKDELSFILSRVYEFLEQNKDVDFQVNVPAFTLAVRQHEAGRPGLEFGIMHPDAINTNLETQLEWFLETLKKDTIRWNTGKLWNGWNKEDFKDFIEYFAKKYAPPGAENDPLNLNRFWEDSVRYYYELFRWKGGEEQ